MQLAQYSPWRIRSRLEQDLDDTLGENWDDILVSSFQELAAVDAYVEGDKLTIEVILPSFAKDDIRLNVTDSRLDITAEHEDSTDKSTQRMYLLHESGHSYHRTLSLPEGAVPDKTEATYGDDILTVTMPIAAHTEAGKQVPIK